MSSSRNPQIYVGGGGRNIRYDDLRGSFEKFGKIRDIKQYFRYAFIVSYFVNLFSLICKCVFIQNFMI